MDKLVVVLSCLLLASCSALSTSKPLQYHTINTQQVRWDKPDAASRCKPNTVYDFKFTLNKSGHWTLNASLENNDAYRYRPLWHNELSLSFLNGQNQPVRLALYTDALPSPSKRAIEKTGFWPYGQAHFKDIHSAVVTLNHHCKGLYEE